MPLRIPAEPAGAAQATLTTLRALGVTPPASLQWAYPMAQPSSSAGHYVYEITLDDILAGKGLSPAYRVAFRVLVMKGASAVAAAETPAKPDGALGASAAQLMTGKLVAATEAAIRRAEADPTIAAGSYELRLLRLPAIYVMALWLHRDAEGDSPEDDRLLPLAPSPPFLNAELLYTPGPFFDSVQAAAATARTFPPRQPAP